MPPFAGLADSDFEAFAPQKWKSNVYNRERLEVKQRLLEWARELGAGLAAQDGSPLAIEASVEHPALWNHKQVDAQHLFFSRNEGARRELDAIIDRGQSIAHMIDDPTPLRNHLFLCASLSHQSMEFALRLHPDARVDRQNLERKVADHFEREKLLHLLRSLGQEFSVGTSTTRRPVTQLDDADLEPLLAELAQPASSSPLQLGAPTRLLSIARTVPRAAAIAQGGELTALARGSLEALLPLYHFIAWSRDNDFVSMKETLARDKEQRRQRGLAKNDRVRIIRGMFAGKIGVVQDVDAKGALRVLVGKMAVKVDADDVTKD